MSVNGIDGSNGINNVRSAPRTDISGSNGDFSGALKSAMSSQKKSVDLDGIFQRASETYNVPVDLLKAVAKAESNFNPRAQSGAGAQGIMQLMPATARGLGVTDPFDPEQNIMGGAKYLSGMLKKFGGNTQLALAAYNAGPGNVAKYRGIPPFKETQNYVKRVMAYCGTQLTAGTVSPGEAENAGASLAQQAIEPPAVSNEVSSNTVDVSSLIEIYHYELQKSLLARLDSTPDTGKDSY